MKTKLKKILKCILPSKLKGKYYQYKYGVNRKKIEKQLLKLDQMGVDSSALPNIIISLTSYGERLADLHLTLYSLLTQEKKPSKIVLCLSKDEFENGISDLPSKIQDILKWGIDIIWCEDLRSYKKLIPTLDEYSNSAIITADDDVFYPNDWLKKLVASYEVNPQYIHVHNASRIIFDEQNLPGKYLTWPLANSGVASYTTFFKGVGGVLYPPNSLHEDVSKKELFCKLAPMADDIWFWAMAVMQGTKIMLIDEHITSFKSVNVEREFGNNSQTLHEMNVQQGYNDIQLKAVLKHYPVLMTRISERNQENEKNR